MPLYRHYKHELVHIHIPKTGGTSVTRAVESHGGLASFMRKRPATQCGDVPPQHMDIGHTKMFFDLGQIPAFAMVRDPWHRTCSEFVWTTMVFKWTKLNNWLRGVLVDLNHSKYQNHFLPQHKFINEDVELFKYESDWKKLEEYIGSTLHMPDFNVTFREQSRHTYTPPPIEDCLDTEVRRQWTELYKEDLELHQSL